jgi:hypothetical protein
VGVGDPLEAEYLLLGPIPAGRWHFVGDGIIIQPVDVRFELFWRDDAGEHPIATWDTHFEPIGGGEYTATPYEVDADAGEIPAKQNDLLVLRYSGMNTTVGMAYIPNGEGARAEGRIPFIELPQ